MDTRQALLSDADDLSAMLQKLTALGKRNIPSDIDYVRITYITHPDKIRCTVAHDTNGTLLGLQILKRASTNNPYGVTPGWGIIGTHVHPDAARRGVGKSLFAATQKAAIDAGVTKIDATIGSTNIEGLAYYEAMGFRTYKTSDGRTCKLLTLAD